MIKAKVSVENMDGFDHQLEEVIKAIDGNLNAVATLVEQDAKTTSAFIDRTGNLRDSIKKRKSKFEDGGYIVVASGRGKDKGYHASLVEFGHVLIAWGEPTGKRVAPRPFLRPALEVGIRKAMELFK